MGKHGPGTLSIPGQSPGTPNFVQLMVQKKKEGAFQIYYTRDRDNKQDIGQHPNRQ
jgi:hypothetical protein